MKNPLIRQVMDAAFYPLLFLSIMWGVFLAEWLLNVNFTFMGVLPRSLKGVPGIVTSVFIHGGFGHIASNSPPLLILGMILFYFYKKIARAAFFWIWIISGVWLWIGGRNNEHYPVYHIGASTLVYGLATFLFFSGVFRKHIRLMVVSALVVFMYGSIMWGIFPLKEEISWEGHLFGAIAGVLVAFNYRKEGPQKITYQWEEEDELPDDENAYWKQTDEAANNEENNPLTEIKINYIYKNTPFKNSPEDKTTKE